jgi:polysaccharide biosynthesis protein VpsQ
MDDPPKSKRRPVAVTAAVAFIGFFIWIIVIADQSDGVPWWSFIEMIPFGDKVGHLGLVSTLSLLCNFAFTRWKSDRWRFITRTTWVLLILLSLEELSQGFIPHRHLDVFDWLADLAGLAVGQFCAMKLARHHSGNVSEHN